MHINQTFASNAHLYVQCMKSAHALNNPQCYATMILYM